MGYTTGYSLRGTLEIAYSEDLDINGIYSELVEVNVLTDEESSDDEDNARDLNQLGGRQLRTMTEIVLSNNDRVAEFPPSISTQDQAVKMMSNRRQNFS
ncbi:hypothetical protein NQ314_010571 [Rhamnusium bicolor]|uniref:Uncharacterized protein n=1 Tax=Rhamnusium bicolor TaxID=1586634 RepID=A0AAV8XPF4_9CUCU|nr:hypothetical protein NQ314_010571 [Rhamnusium bicolor]